MNDIRKMVYSTLAKRAQNNNSEVPTPASEDELSNNSINSGKNRLTPVDQRATKVDRNFDIHHEIDSILDLEIDLNLDEEGDPESDSAVHRGTAGNDGPAGSSNATHSTASKSSQIHEPPHQRSRSTYQSHLVSTRRNSKLVNPVHHLPLKSLQNYGLLLPDSPRCRLGEQYRHIKRSLLLNIRNAQSSSERLSSIMVTSALSGEGKTFSALNLALSFSQEQDHSVLFIDADVLKSSASRLLGFDRDAHGLTDLLAGDISHPFDVSHTTQYSNLCVLPAGRKHANTTELLSTKRMSDLLTAFCQDEKDRIIIMDAPPLLQTTEACVLADHAGQVAFVVSSASTGRSNVKAALAKIGKEKQIGIIINKLRHSANDARYNYSYD